MLTRTLEAWILVAFLSQALASPNFFGLQRVNLWRLKQQQQSSGVLVQESSDLGPSEFPEQWFVQRLDHFSDNSSTFGQRYWVNDRHYTPGLGGPVIVLDGGETSGEDRLPYLDTGIVEILCRATGGLGVVLEHRYYGM